MGNRLGLVIPTLNEERNIGTLLARVRANLDRLSIAYEILVVDDESNDETYNVVEALSGDDPRIRLLSRHGVRGLAGAITFGWAHTNANILGVIDADLQHPPELLPSLLELIEQGCDLAIASRYAGNQHGTADWNRVRRLISTVGTWTTVPFQRSDIRVRDPLSGYFLLRRHCIEGLQLQRQGFKLLLEILVRGRIRSVAEVPYHFGTRHAGASKAGVRVAFDYLHLLGRLSRHAISRSDAA